jgi:ATP-dependent helicase/nuclease subunit B
MGVTRVFLGWDRPLCETVPEWLLAQGTPGLIDLRGTVVGMPTRQSSWRLRAALPLAAHDRHGAALLAPEIVTASVLISPPPRPGRASEIQSLLAWRHVLLAAPAGDLDAFLGGQRPASGSWALPIARRLIGLRRELADGALTIGEVAACGVELVESERWQAMAELERRYLDCLASWKLSDALAEQIAYARAGHLAPDVQRVVLAAVPDPPRLLLTLLQAWAGNGGTVVVLVAAPPDEAGAFDAWGRPLPDAWDNRNIALDDRDIVLAANPEDQAACIAGLLKDGLAGRTADHTGTRPTLAIGVPDRETVAPVQRELAALGLPAFDPQNRPLSDTPLFRLVQALLAWRVRPGYAETATLLRHPDVLAALPDPDDVLRELDDVQAERLPVTFADLRRAARHPAGGNTHARPPERLAAALDHLDAWSGLRDASSLATSLRNALQSIYAQRLLHPGQAADTAFQQAGEVIDQALRELADAEAAGQAGADAATVLLARLQDATIKSERACEPLDLEGWLELAWNPAPVLCVAGMNEGFVPDGHVGDLFLPDSLRRQLGLRDDRLRVARDAYVLAALCAQRSNPAATPPPRVVLLVGKRANAGDPLRPSRLLFRCPDDVLVRRARNLFRDPPPVRTAAAHAVSFTLDPTRVPPACLTQRLPGRISPTAFRDYLQCPLRFYLKRVLQMESQDDRAREPDARGFGNLCHAVVEAMARDPGRIWACGDAARLSEWLARQLDAAAAAQYGARPWLGVTLAIETATRRLHAFAAQQVAWHAAGWEIIECETARHSTTLNGVTVGGRIDRIDRHRDGSICVLDYKTADQAKPPSESHLAPAGDDADLPEAILSREFVEGLGRSDESGGRTPARSKRWTDLQLPLYREMLRATQGPDVRIGHILLPAARGETSFAVWDSYSDALHGHALACAAAVIRRISDGIFWPPAARPPRYDDFGDLLLNDAERTFVPPPNPWPLRDAARPPGASTDSTGRDAR